MPPAALINITSATANIVSVSIRKGFDLRKAQLPIVI
jgi:hypothetical protein